MHTAATVRTNQPLRRICINNNPLKVPRFVTRSLGHLDGRAEWSLGMCHARGLGCLTNKGQCSMQSGHGVAFGKIELIRPPNQGTCSRIIGLLTMAGIAFQSPMIQPMSADRMPCCRSVKQWLSHRSLLASPAAIFCLTREKKPQPSRSPDESQYTSCIANAGNRDAWLAAGQGSSHSACAI